MKGEFEGTIERISDLFEKLKLPYHLTGGIACSYYAEPRLTSFPPRVKIS